MSKRPRSEAGPSPPPPRLLYFVNNECASLADEALASAHPERSALTHSLVAALRLPGLAAVRYGAATLDELREYHSRSYVDTLAAGEAASEEAREAAGLAYDCPCFPGQLRYAQLVAGGALAAADALSRCLRDASAPRLAVHWDGGRHHARRDSAAGFCFVNDAVLACQRLRRSGFRRVLYADLDVHHGDAVQNAFLHSDAVLFLSLHKRAPGFYPGSGAAEEAGAGRGRGHTLNLPLADGLRDALFCELFSRLLAGVRTTYNPDAVVLLLGCDGLAGDPLGGWSLTPAALAAAAQAAAALGAPLLLLGGGGYSPAAAARAWAAVTAALCGAPLPPAAPVPDHARLMAHGPSFAMWAEAPAAGLPPDENGARRGELLEAAEALLARLRAEYEEEGEPD